MSHSPHAHALTLVATPELRVADDDLKKLQRMAVNQIAAIGEMENRAAMGAILAGLTLHRVKASLPHGEFGPWITQITAEDQKRTGGAFLSQIKARQCQYYMRLALIFLGKCRVAKPDLLALPGDQTELTLDGATGPAKRFADKLKGFVGDLSLNELLIRHGIKGVGLKSALEEGEGGARRPGEDFYAEVAERLLKFRSIITDRTALARLSRDQLRALKAEVTDSYSQFQRLYEEAYGKEA